jgi:putative MATE family efflux protein
LSYGTTARSARHCGAGDRASAVAEGVQATWLALALGALFVVVVQAAAVAVVAAIASKGDIADEALSWLRIAVMAAPAMLMSLAGNGWMRGVQDTMRPLRYVVIGFTVSAMLCPLLVYGWLGLPRWELAGSAAANLIGQWVAALMFGRALLVEGAPLGINWSVLRAQLAVGRDLFMRTVAFQTCFVSAAAVAARFGAAAVAAHQVVLQLWNFLALVLDSLAIAAQSLVGAALGAGQAAHAKSVAWQVTAFSAVAATMLAAVLGAAAGVLPSLFTIDRAVLDAVRVPWWFLVAQLPLAGVVFGLDGVLLGAGDREIHAQRDGDQRAGRLPAADLVVAGFGWGLAGIWSGLSTFTVLRLAFVGWRAFSGRWAVLGTGQ